jgi:hypothetical protein
MDNTQIIKGALGLLGIMAIAVLLGFVLTAGVTLLGLSAWHTIEAAPMRHLMMSVLLFGSTGALVACRQRVR